MPTRRDSARAPRIRPSPSRITAPLAAAIDAGISPRLEKAFHSSAATAASRPPLRALRSRPAPSPCCRNAGHARSLPPPRSPFKGSSFRRRAVSPTHDIRNGRSRYRSPWGHTTIPPDRRLTRLAVSVDLPPPDARCPCLPARTACAADPDPWSGVRCAGVAYRLHEPLGTTIILHWNLLLRQ